MSQPTSEQIAKLPRWAQDWIRDKERERDNAVRLLNEFTNDQTPTAIWVEEYACTGEAKGPTSKRNYIQGYKVQFEHAGVDLSVMLTQKDDSQRGYGIELQFSPTERRVNHVAICTRAFNTIELVAKENMR